MSVGESYSGKSFKQKRNRKEMTIENPKRIPINWEDFNTHKEMISNFIDKEIAKGKSLEEAIETIVSSVVIKRWIYQYTKVLEYGSRKKYTDEDVVKKIYEDANKQRNDNDEHDER